MVSLLSATVAGLLMATGPAVTPVPAPAPAPSIPSAHYSLLAAPERRVRAADPQLHDLLREGVARSATFAGLMTALNRSDVIVYIERLMTMPRDTVGRLTIVPMKAGARYLRIQIRQGLTRHEAIAIIGHEMQHALEVALATEVRDATGLIELYERIGHSSGGEHAYDTNAAQDTGRQVKRELTATIS
jgi:hypothetical protein